MKVLILGGTGLISSGITSACRALGYDVAHLNRGSQPAPEDVHTISGDRYNEADLRRAARFQPDVVIDMLGFSAADAELALRVFGGAVRQLIFCSTCCVYDILGGGAPFREDSPLGSHWHYGRNKQRCEEIYLRAQAEGAFACTIFRPAHVYGPNFFIHQFGFDGALLFNRIAHGLPVLLFEEGRQLWQSCDRDDAGLAFAYACLRERCYGQVYNLSHGEILSWREHYERIAALLDRTPDLRSLGSEVLPRLSGGDYDFFRNIARYSFAAESAKIQADIPEFRRRSSYEDGARVFWERHRRGDLPLNYDPLLMELLDSAARLS
jgi:nucleoside-diphosphate-sugar epimerase